MSPYWHGAPPFTPHMAYHRGWRRGPSRAIWFIIGAVSAVAFMRHEEKKHRAIAATAGTGAGGEGYGQGGYGQRWRHGWGGCDRDRQEVLQQQHQQQPVVDNGGFVTSPSPAPTYQTPAAQLQPQPQPQSQSQAQQPWTWDDETRKFNEMRQQAHETVRSLLSPSPF